MGNITDKILDGTIKTFDDFILEHLSEFFKKNDVNFLSLQMEVISNSIESIKEISDEEIIADHISDIESKINEYKEYIEKHNPVLDKLISLRSEAEKMDYKLGYFKRSIINDLTLRINIINDDICDSNDSINELTESLNNVDVNVVRVKMINDLINRLEKIKKEFKISKENLDNYNKLLQKY